MRVFRQLCVFTHSCSRAMEKVLKHYDLVWQVILQVDKNYNQGDQVFASYGQERPNYDLLIRYKSFVPIGPQLDLRKKGEDLLVLESRNKIDFSFLATAYVCYMHLCCWYGGMMLLCVVACSYGFVDESSLVDYVELEVRMPSCLMLLLEVSWR
jgi:hypothetical protein